MSSEYPDLDRLETKLAISKYVNEHLTPKAFQDAIAEADRERIIAKHYDMPIAEYRKRFKPSLLDKIKAIIRRKGKPKE